MNAENVVFITEKELLQKIADGVSKKNVWQKPMLRLTKSGSDYNYMSDTINEKYQTRNFQTVPVFNTSDDVDLYYYLGAYLWYDEEIHRYAVGLCNAESKPVISFFCVEDKGCSIEEIPAWMEDEFEIVMLKLNY